MTAFFDWIVFVAILGLGWWWTTSGARRFYGWLHRNDPDPSHAPEDYWVVHPPERFSVEVGSDGCLVGKVVPAPSRVSRVGRPIIFAGGSVSVRKAQATDGSEVHVDINLDGSVAAYAVTVNGKAL